MYNSRNKIAAVIATYNRPHFLSRRSLPSILNQTRVPDIILVVDDSNPFFRRKNKQIISEFQKVTSKIRYLENKFTKGASGSWNTAIRQLEKMYERCIVAILDDDDKWCPNYIEESYRNCMNNLLDMSISGIIRYDEKNPSGIKLPIPSGFNSSQFLIGNPNVQGSNLFLKLNVLLKAGLFDESLVSTTDRDLCIRISDLSNVKIGFLKDHLVCHYAFENYERLSNKGSPSKIKGLIQFYNKYKERMTLPQEIKFLERASKLFSLNLINNTSVSDLITQLKDRIYSC